MVEVVAVLGQLGHEGVDDGGQRDVEDVDLVVPTRCSSRSTGPSKTGVETT